MAALSIFIAVSSSDTVTGKTKLSGWPGAVGTSAATLAVAAGSASIPANVRAFGDSLARPGDVATFVADRCAYELAPEFNFCSRP